MPCLGALVGTVVVETDSVRRRCGSSRLRDSLLFAVSPPAGSAILVLTGRAEETEAVTHCPHGRNSPARSPVKAVPVVAPAVLTWPKTAYPAAAG